MKRQVLHEKAHGGLIPLLRRAIGRRLQAMLTLFWVSACSHTLVLESVPSDSSVYLLDQTGQKVKLLGRTPLATEELSILKSTGVIVESAGHVPLTVIVPFQNSTVSKLSVKLTPYDEKFVQGLPFDLHKKVIDQLAGELIDLQQTLYGGNKEEAEIAIREAESRLGQSSRYHQIVGSFRFYQGQFEQAVRSLSKSLEIDPRNETARRMLVLTDVKVASSTQAARNRAYANFNVAASEIANLGHGYLVRTKSSPSQPDYDGFEIIIPTDILFKPYSGKFKSEGLLVLSRLTEELKKNDHPRNILVEGHTGSDLYAELRNMPAHTAGSTKLQGIWEISSERASAVVTYLKSEGVMATRWSIAGYGDSRPLSLPDHVKNNREKFDPEVLSRRVIIKVTLNEKKSEKDVISSADAEKLKERLERILPNEEEDTPRPARPARANSRLAAPVPTEQLSNEESSEGSEIPRNLPKKTILQKRANTEKQQNEPGGTALRARPLNQLQQTEGKLEEKWVNPRLKRGQRTKELLKGIESDPPLPAVPQLRPQD